MELKEDKRPLTARFTSPRDVTLVAPDGSRCQIFTAGQTLPVHKSLFSVAIEHGLMPEDSLEVATMIVDVPENKSQEVIVTEGLTEACKVLISRANPQDFKLNGEPRAASVKKLVDFDFTTRDVQRAFEQAMHEVDQYGDDNPEHSEPVSEPIEG
jgi:hypothetical protein